MARLDPEFNVLLAQKAYFEEHPSEGTFAVSPDTQFYIALKFTGDLDALIQAGFTLGNSVGNIAYGVTDLAGLEALAKHPQVEQIEKQRKAQLQLDESIPDLRANEVWARSDDRFTGYNGKDVIVGVIDTGIDIRHHAFRKPDGSSRIVALWDQTLTPQGGESAPPTINHPPISASPITFGYGVEYSRGQITDTIQNASPAIAVRHQDQDGHGTHVAGIAAGDGSQSGGCHGGFHYIGVATDADIAVVRLWGLTDGDTNRPTPASDFKLDAIRYLLNVANLLGEPIAINLSLGSFSEQMDGTSADCVAVDQLLTNNTTGTAIVYSAGNNGDNNFHASETVPAGPTATRTLRFKLMPDDQERRRIVIRYSGSNLQIRLQSPVSGANGLINFVSFGNSGNSATANGGGAGSSVFISNTQPNEIVIAITPPTNTAVTPNVVTGPNIDGIWTIDLRDSGTTATPFDAFCTGGSSHDDKSPFFLDHATSRSTLGTDATGIECISVGAYQVGGRLAGFSARGPTLDAAARTKPEICAPGVNITSAGIQKDRGGCQACCCECCQDFYVDMNGTSQAAPHVTGLIALMLHKDPTLTHTQIRALLVANPTAKPGDSTPDENLGWGSGKANAKAVIDQVTQVNAPVTLSIVELPGTEPFEILQKRLLGTIRGPELSELFPRHVREVMALVNSNRKVATVWHRCRGPVWIRLALRAAYTPGMPLPLEVDGMCLLEAIRRFGEVIKKYASPSFLEDILRYEPELALFEEGMTLDRVIDVFGNRTQSPAVISMQPVWDPFQVKEHPNG
jgi:subtilisin family serine protease